MEHELSAAVGWPDLNGPPVPDYRVVPGIADAACPWLRWKRDHHRAVEPISSLVPALIQSDIVVVIGKLPGTAEIDPAVAGKLWARMEIAMVHEACLHVRRQYRYAVASRCSASIVPIAVIVRRAITRPALIPLERHRPPVSSRGTRDLVVFLIVTW